jgi:hypothetical protein
MTEQAISPLRRRMIEDMSIRKFAAKTQHDYVQGSRTFAIQKHVAALDYFGEPESRPFHGRATPPEFAQNQRRNK